MEWNANRRLVLGGGAALVGSALIKGTRAGHLLPEPSVPSRQRFDLSLLEEDDRRIHAEISGQVRRVRWRASDLPPEHVVKVFDQNQLTEQVRICHTQHARKRCVIEIAGTGDWDTKGAAAGFEQDFAVGFPRAYTGDPHYQPTFREGGQLVIRYAAGVQRPIRGAFAVRGKQVEIRGLIFVGAQGRNKVQGLIDGTREDRASVVNFRSCKFGALWDPSKTIAANEKDFPFAVNVNTGLYVGFEDCFFDGCDRAIRSFRPFCLEVRDCTFRNVILNPFTTSCVDVDGGELGEIAGYPQPTSCYNWFHHNLVLPYRDDYAGKGSDVAHTNVLTFLHGSGGPTSAPIARVNHLLEGNVILSGGESFLVNGDNRISPNINLFIVTDFSKRSRGYDLICGNIALSNGFALRGNRARHTRFVWNTVGVPFRTRVGPVDGVSESWSGVNTYKDEGGYLKIARNIFRIGRGIGVENLAPDIDSPNSDLSNFPNARAGTRPIDLLAGRHAPFYQDKNRPRSERFWIWDLDMARMTPDELFKAGVDQGSRAEKVPNGPLFGAADRDTVGA